MKLGQDKQTFSHTIH